MFEHTRGKRLGIENLERRAMLAGDVTVAVVNGNLIINGDAEDNAIELTAGAVADSVLVTGIATPGGATTINSGAAASVEFGGVTGDIIVRLRDGNDSLTAGSLAVAEDLKISMGSGDDEVTLESGLTIGGDLVIETNGGDDTVLATGTVEGTAHINTGTGDDEVSLVDMVVNSQDDDKEEDGEDGNGWGGPGGALGRIFGLLFGGGGFFKNDHGHGHDEESSVSVDLGSGDDSLSVDGLTAARLKVAAGSGDDDVTLAGVTADDIKLDLGWGDDTASIASSTADRVFASMGAGDDELTIAADVSIATSLVMIGGSGFDTLDNALPPNVPLNLVRVGFESIV